MPTGPLKIILIRAGRYDYAEVELGGSLQIVGPNNTGKTTLINTLQFLYVDDLRTISFGSYTLEQTLAYYFPDQYSYVLFECQGATGRVVIGWRGQSQTSGADPDRFYYLGPYESEDYFDAKRQVREPRDVTARIAAKDRQYRIIKSAQEHRELLLPAAGAEGKGLGLVALRDPDRFRRFRESLKDLLSLNTISQDQMRERLLTLAEVRADLPALDVRKLFGEDYDRIRRRRDALRDFKKHEEHVRLLTQRFADLAKVRGELISRWSDLREKRRAFEQGHEARLDSLRVVGLQQNKAAAVLADTLKDRNDSRDLLLIEKGRLEGGLADLENRAKTFASFSPELAQASRQNLKNEELRLGRLLGQAETENRDKARQKVDLYEGLLRDKQKSIANFYRLAITALRRHFSDDELNAAFRVLNFGLLETPLGPDGITVIDEAQLLALIRALAGRVRAGVYEDETLRVKLRDSPRDAAMFDNVEKLREELKDHSEMLAHWQAILKAINQRDKLAGEFKQCQADLAALEKQIFAYEAFGAARAEEPRLRRDLKRAGEELANLDGELADLARKKKEAEQSQRQAEEAVVAEENAYNQLMGRFVQCIFPEFSAPPVAVADIPEDFDSAIGQFLHQQNAHETLREKVDESLRLVVQLLGEAFNGADAAETVANLAAELDALVDKTDALERDWNALIQGLRGTFAGVLKELSAIRSAVDDLNRQFAKVPVSNLKAIRLDVLEAGDLVSWIRRLVDLQQPGLFEDDTHLDQTLRNFRQKLEGSPLIGFSQLFSLGITVEGEDGVKHHYQDLKQIESHGTTIAIKVLFNLLVLRHYLREGQCVMPFFLDEVHSLDQSNRHAILETARKLGFLSITAAPESITEVDALYFLQPHQGRIILRHSHRLGVKSAAHAMTP